MSTNKWSPEAHANMNERRRVRIVEAADALSDILEENQGKFKFKHELVGIIEEEILAKRVEGGTPKVNGKVVRPANTTFINNHWGQICLCCAQDKHYPVWKPHYGIRLGTLLEYHECQKILSMITTGIVDRHNERADIIRAAGKPCGYLSEPLLLAAKKKPG